MLYSYSRLLQALLLALIASGFLTSSGWAAVPEGLTAGQVAALEQRVRERWAVLSARDYEEVWKYSTPVYRSVFPKDLYVLQFSYAVDRELTGVEVTHYDAAAAVASVTVRVMSKPLKQTFTASASIGAVPVVMDEKWVLVGGQWWFSVGGK